MEWSGESYTQIMVNGLLAETSHRDLTIVCGDPVLNDLSLQQYHLSLLSPLSPLLKSLMDTIPFTRGDQVTLCLPEVRGNTLATLMDCVYSGICGVGGRERVQEVLDLSRELELKVNLESDMPVFDDFHSESSEEMAKDELSGDVDSLDDTIPSMPPEMLIEELEVEEQRLTQDIMSFIDNLGDISEQPCTECKEGLNKDTFIDHYKKHVEDIQETKEKVMGEYVSSLKEDIDSDLKKDDGQIKWDYMTNSEKADFLEKKQLKISNDISSLLSLFKKGVVTLKCSECEVMLTQQSVIDHYKEHIVDLNDSIVKLSKSGKRKREDSEENVRKNRVKDINGTGDKNPNITQIRKQVQTQNKIKSEVNSSNVDNTISVKDIKKEKKGIDKVVETPVLTKNPSDNSFINSESSNVSLALSEYVQEGTKEWRHEWKKAHDRLYKRMQRIMRIKGVGPKEIQKIDVKTEMLASLKARNAPVIKPIQQEIKKEIIEKTEPRSSSNDKNNVISEDIVNQIDRVGKSIDRSSNGNEEDLPFWSMIRNNSMLHNMDEYYHANNKYMTEELTRSIDPMLTHAVNSEDEQMQFLDPSHNIPMEDFQDVLHEFVDDNMVF